MYVWFHRIRQSCTRSKQTGKPKPTFLSSSHHDLRSDRRISIPVCLSSLTRSLALPLLNERRRGSGRKTQIRISAQIHFRRFYTRRLCDDQIDSLLRSFSILNPLGFSSDVYTCIVNVFISHVIFLVPNRSRIPVTDWIRTTGYNSCDSRSQINNKNRKWFLFSFCYSFFVLRSFSFFIHSFDVQYIRTTRIQKNDFSPCINIEPRQNRLYLKCVMVASFN